MAVLRDEACLCDRRSPRHRVERTDDERRDGTCTGTKLREAAQSLRRACCILAMCWDGSHVGNALHEFWDKLSVTCTAMQLHVWMCYRHVICFSSLLLLHALICCADVMLDPVQSAAWCALSSHVICCASVASR